MLQPREDFPNRCAAMTHCVLLLVEKLGNRSAVREQEDGVVAEPPDPSLMIKDSTVDHSLAGSNDPVWGRDGDGANESSLPMFYRYL